MHKRLLKQLRDKCLLYNQFILDKGIIPDSATLRDALHKSDEMIQQAYEKGDLKPLKAMDLDINDQLNRHWPKSLSEDFNQLMRDKLTDSAGLLEYSSEMLDKILKRKKIIDHLEYQLLLNYVDEIYADKNKKAQLKQINKIITAYETDNNNLA